MAWAKEDTDTLTSASPSIDLTTNTLIFNVLLDHLFADSGGMQELLRFNNDSGSNYAFRRSENGGGDTTGVSQTFIGAFHPGSPDGFVVNYIIDISGEETLTIGWGVGNAISGAGNAPSRREVIGKWVTGGITQVDMDVSVASNFDTDSNSTLLGTD